MTEKYVLGPYPDEVPVVTNNKWNGVDWTTSRGIVRTTIEGEQHHIYRLTANHVTVWEMHADMNVSPAAWISARQAAIREISHPKRLVRID